MVKRTERGTFWGGFKKDPNDKRDFLLAENPEVKMKTAMVYKAATSVDHTNYMSSVKYQGRLGSCVAFAAAAMKEWQEQKEHMEEIANGKNYKRKDSTYNLSEQWIYWNCKKIDPWPNEEGTNIRSAMKVLQKIGVPVESGWPYTDDPINIGEPEKWAHLVARWAKIGSYWRVQNIDELKEALLDGPVVIGLLIFEEFYTWKEDGKSYISLPKRPDICYGGHAVCAVGFNDNTQLIKIKNSWSFLWGDRGYGYLPYNYIKKYMSDAWAAKDISVTKEMIKGEVEKIT